LRQSKYLDVVIEVSPAISGCLGRTGGCCCEAAWLLVIDIKKGGICPLADPIGI